MISPRLRRALHEAVDIICDALNEDERAAPPTPTRRRRRPDPPASLPKGADEATVRRALEAGRRAGLL